MLHCLLTIVFNQMFVEDVSSRFGGLFENVFFSHYHHLGKIPFGSYMLKGKWAEMG